MNGVDKLLEEQLRAACTQGPISYRDYIQLALYSENGGYYTQSRERVGRHSQQDFYTAESLGKVFAECVTTAAADLLGAELAAQSTFIEIAAEPETSLITALPAHPFAAHREIRQGEPIQAEGPVVIFANEWLDALPFHRLVFADGAWRERAVTWGGSGPEETLLATPSIEVEGVAHRLPEDAPEGYELDLPLDAENALAALLAQPWHGLICLFDYGKTWHSLLNDCPAGTARTFQNHQRGNDLLDQPGRKDITCDVCWDWHEAQLRSSGFAPVQLESQESFIVQRAQRAAERIVQSSAGAFSRDRQTLMELIHPAHMGQRFQVLWGIREA